ncbi:hypothetical protein Sste5344_010135 [Sporothrix stenoceras]
MFGPQVVQHVVIVSSVFMALSFIIVCLRLYTRSRIVRIVSVEDYLIIVALIAAVGFLAVEILQVKFGLGQHIGDIPAEHLAKFLQNIEINVAIVCASVPALKPLVSKIAPKLLESSVNSASRSRTNAYLLLSPLV